MRIGYILDIFPRLSESFVLNEIIELKKLGHEILIFCIAPSGEEFHHPEVDEYDLLENTYYFLSSKKKIDRLKIAFKSFRAINLWVYKSKGIRKKIAIAAVASHFSEIAEDLDLYVLHAHFNGIPALLAVMLSKKLRIPFTFTGHASDIFEDVHAKSLKERMQRAYKIITPSYFNRDYLYLITGVSKNKIEVIRACSMLEKFKGVKRREKENIILSAGRLVEKKGIKYAILAVKELIAEYPEVEYRIVGTGPLENGLKNLVKSLDLQYNVTFLGSLTSEELLDEMKYASIFVLPCVRAKNGDMDVCPVALQEAMVAKIPVVSTKLASIPELIEHGKEGFLVSPANSKELADAVRILLEDKSLRAEFAENGRIKIEKEFNIHKEVRKLVKLWREIDE